MFAQKLEAKDLFRAGLKTEKKALSSKSDDAYPEGDTFMATTLTAI